MNGFVSRLVDVATSADRPVSTLFRLSLLLALAWLLHAALPRANPRWRVLLWRGCAVAALVLVPLGSFGPAIPLALLPPIATGPPIASDVGTSAPFAAAPALEGIPLAGDFVPQPRIGEPYASDSGSFPAAEPAPRAGEAPTVERPWSLSATLWTVWIFGLAVGLARETIAVVRIGRLRRRAHAADGAVIAQAAHIAQRLGLGKPFDTLVTRELQTPCVVGLSRPAILLPGGSGPSDDELPAVLTHEIQHLKGADLPWNAVLRGVGRLFWFHPLAWPVRLAHVSACDAVCDAVAADLTGDVTAYCRTLARLALRAGTSEAAIGLAMARPSSTRRRIEALRYRVHGAGLPRRLALGALAAGLIAAGLLGTTSLTRAAGDADKESARAKISGTVQDAQGRPVVGATVQIQSAGVRVGSGPFCPTGYADCGKNSKTDDKGRFLIASLDPTLVFRLLVFAEGYEPKTLQRVDPQAAETIEAKLAARAMPKDPACIVSGVVFAPDGKPAVGAVIEPVGCKTAEKRWWGVMPGVDALTLTDAEGRFVIVCAKPVEGLDLRIEARGAARRNFELVYSGLEHHRLELEPGTTVQGRIVQGGRGVPGVSVGVVQADRGLGFLGTYQAQTDAEGRFSLPNLPAGEELQLYGIMDSLRDVGAVASRRFKSAESGVSDLGDLPVVPACRLTGRLVLSDDRPVPAHTRVMVARLQAWDRTFVEADAAGRFVADGIPPEPITMYMAIPGYRLSPKNRSFEPLNAAGLLGLVENDIDDLVVLFEPGEPLRPDFAKEAQWRTAAERGKLLQNFPLAGVTADLETPEPPPVANLTATAPPLPKIEIPPAPAEVRPSDAGPAKTITGLVTDAQGKPLAGANVWLPVRRLTSTETLTAMARSDEAGRFRLAVPEAWLPSNVMRRESTVWAYAAGHAIGTANVYKQLDGKTEQSCKVALPPVSDISFVVLSADGQPAVGAAVAPRHFLTERAYEFLPGELLEQITATADREGRVRFPALTREGIDAMTVNFAGHGKQEFRVGMVNKSEGSARFSMRSTDPAEREIHLRGVGRIEGRIVAEQMELTRGMMVEVESDSLSQPEEPLVTKGVAEVAVDPQGRFVIREIADGRLQVFTACDKRLPVQPRLPEEEVPVLFEQETLRLEIPLEMCGRVHGIVRAKDSSRPIAGAVVWVSYGAPHQGDQVVTDEQGAYSAYALPGKLAVHILYLPGQYAQLGEPWIKNYILPPEARELELPTIDVVPTTTLTGTLLDRAGQPLAGVEINGDVGNRRHGFGKTDAHGMFELPGVPIGIQLERFEIRLGDEHLEGKPESTDPLVVRVQPGPWKPSFLLEKQP